MEPGRALEVWFERVSGLSLSELKAYLFDQSFANRPPCAVGFFLEPSDDDVSALQDDPVLSEFLDMCAYFLAFEWEQGKLLLHVAHQASLGNIAVELARTFVQPLTAIRTAAEIVDETVVSPEAAEGITVVMENVERLRRQMQEFQRLAVLREDSVETVRLDDYIEQALDMLAVAIQNRNVTVEKDFRAEGECVLLNGTVLARTFLDLILGALRTVEVGSTVSLSLADRRRDWIAFDIRYRPVYPEAVEVSSPALRAPDEGVDRSHPGLQLALRAVHSCGGTLTVEREPDKHVHVCIVLPRNVTRVANRSRGGGLLMAGTPYDETGGASPEHRPVVVIMDTDAGVRWALDKGLQRSGYEVVAASTIGDALKAAHEREVRAVVVELLAEAGLTPELIDAFADTPGAPRVICVSVDTAPQLVIEAMRRGAADFVPKPFSLTEIRSALARALAVDTPRTPMNGPGGRGVTPSPSASLLIGVSPPMQELREVTRQVAQTDLNCLIRGESGTGKDMVAREIHRLSRRHDKPFVKVNCTALPEQLLESELFGYEKGAFTGAASSKPGRFELANRGIIFLDEIGDMHASLQAKLLQVIEHKEFTKLGGRRHINVDVQIIAATNADLEARTKEARFRDDLYFRLNEVCIWVPPLSSRKEDVPLLVRHFIRKHGKFRGDKPLQLTGEDLANLTSLDWPGNVRELESTIKRWLALGKPVLPSRHAGARAGTPAPSSQRRPPAIPKEPGITAKGSEAGKSEADVILDVLEAHQWNRRKACQALGMSYQTLRRRIEKYGLNRPR